MGSGMEAVYGKDEQMRGADPKTLPKIVYDDSHFSDL